MEDTRSQAKSLRRNSIEITPLSNIAAPIQQVITLDSLTENPKENFSRVMRPINPSQGWVDQWVCHFRQSSREFKCEFLLIKQVFKTVSTH